MVRLRGRLRGIRLSARKYRTNRQEAQYWRLKEKIANEKRVIARVKAKRQLMRMKAQERRLRGSRISPKAKRQLKRIVRQFI